MENKGRDVSAAFETVLETVEAEIDGIDDEIQLALKEPDYARAGKICQQPERAMDFHGRVSQLRQEWKDHFPQEKNLKGAPAPQEFEALQRTREGLIDEQAYYGPILEAITASGGAAEMKKIMEYIFQVMGPGSREVDLEPVPSDPTSPRWRNRVQWA